MHFNENEKKMFFWNYVNFFLIFVPIIINCSLEISKMKIDKLMCKIENIHTDTQ